MKDYYNDNGHMICASVILVVNWPCTIIDIYCIDNMIDSGSIWIPMDYYGWYQIMIVHYHLIIPYTVLTLGYYEDPIGT